MDKNIIDRFMDYVKIESESGNEKHMAKILIKELKDLGLNVKQDKKTKKHHSNTSNIIAKLENKNSEKSVVLCAHLDTVKPGKNIEPYIKDGKILSKGETILGADDKAGVAIIMDVLSKIKNENINHINLEIIFTVHEEAGLYGAKALDYSMIESKNAIVLDSSGKVGGIVIKAPSKEKISATVKGKASHAGIAPEDGINAISVASDAISQMKLSKIDDDTTANIGTMDGGEATNVVPDKVNVTGEVRSFKNNKLKRQVDHMEKCIDNSINKFNAEGKIKKDKLYKGYDLDKDLKLIKDLIKAGKSANIEMFTRESKGGSDANIFNANGIKTVNLVIGTQLAHTVDEYIELDSLKNVSKIVYNYIKTSE